MSKILVLDFETTSVDATTCDPIEFAGQIYDTDTKARNEKYSTLIYEPFYPELLPKIEKLTGITKEEVKHGLPKHQALVHIFNLMVKADIYCAYNAQYDKEILERMFSDTGCLEDMPKKNWFCAMSEYPYSEDMQTCRKLSHRALDLGLKMDMRTKHRAMADVETVLDIFDLVDMNDVLKEASRPWIYLSAKIPPSWEDGGKGKEQVKAHGFGWEGAPGDASNKFPKTWVKRVKQYSREQFPFFVVEIPCSSDIQF